MKYWFIFFILNYITGNIFFTIIILVVAYIILDKMCLNILSSLIFDPIKRRRRIKTLIVELGLNPSNANSAMELGILYYESKKYVKAIEMLDKANERIDYSPRLHAYKGMACIERGDLQIGKDELLKALDMDISVIYGLPYIYLIRCELDSGKCNTDNLAQLEKSISKYATPENFYRLGKLYKNNKNSSKAIEMFSLSIKEYSYVQKKFRRIHRKWVWLSRLNKLTTR